MLSYRSADVEVSGDASYKISMTVGKLLEKQNGDALREGIRGLSEALMETESQPPSSHRLIRKCRRYLRPIVLTSRLLA